MLDDRLQRALLRRRLQAVDETRFASSCRRARSRASCARCDDARLPRRRHADAHLSCCPAWPRSASSPICVDRLRVALPQPRGARRRAGPRFNVVRGDNGQGKTNLLEAVYFVGALRSFRAAQARRARRAWGAARGRLGARVERGRLERLARGRASSAGRRARRALDGKRRATAASYFGGFNVVLFHPRGSARSRGRAASARRFLDRAVLDRGARRTRRRQAQTYEQRRCAAATRSCATRSRASPRCWRLRRAARARPARRRSSRRARRLVASWRRRSSVIVRRLHRAAGRCSAYARSSRRATRRTSSRAPERAARARRARLRRGFTALGPHTRRRSRSCSPGARRALRVAGPAARDGAGAQARRARAPRARARRPAGPAARRRLERARRDAQRQALRVLASARRPDASSPPPRLRRVSPVPRRRTDIGQSGSFASVVIGRALGLSLQPLSSCG